MDEMRAFAIKKAEEARDTVAEELFRRATRIDLDVINNEYENVVFCFGFPGVELCVKWNSDDRFSDPDMVYDILLRLVYNAEDAPRPAVEESHEPMGFVWGEIVEGEEDGEEHDGDTEEFYR